MGEIRNLQNATSKRKENYFKIKNEDIHFLEIFSMALNVCMAVNHSTAKHKDYDPILFYGADTYDPYMMNRCDVEFFCDISDNGEGLPWPGVCGIEMTKIFTDYTQSFLQSCITNIKNIFNKDKDPRNRYWYTKEMLTENSMVLTILHLPDKTIKRILILDLKAVCKELSCGKHDFAKILGENHQEYHPIVLGNPSLTKEDVNKRFDTDLKTILPYIEDGSYIEIQDQNVYEILDLLGFLNYHYFQAGDFFTRLKRK